MTNFNTQKQTTHSPADTKKVMSFNEFKQYAENKVGNQPIINTRTLMGMLKSVRPAGGTGEKVYIDKMLSSIRRMGYTPIIDGAGNIIVNNLPTDNTTSSVMFASHTDSVHRVDSPDGTQQLAFKSDDRTIVGLASQNKQQLGFTPNCLGADCATGNYIMLRLLQANAKGLYVFFREEESGGVGSEYFRQDKSNEKYWDILTHCVSFDRKGYTSIITEQWGGQCASDEFALDFAEAIAQADTNKRLDTFVADPTGSFTDSANFTDVISECTNLSVGYFNQHTANETQDLQFAEDLCDALCRIDWTTLNSYRDPKETIVYSRAMAKSSGYTWFGHAYPFGTQSDYSAYYDDYYTDDPSILLDDLHYNLQHGGLEYAKELVINNPEQAAELLIYLA